MAAVIGALLDSVDIVTEARRWVGTPFRHQMACIGRGADCIGFVRGVAENLGLIEIPAEQRRSLLSYSTATAERMGAALQQFITRSPIDPKSEAPDGYVAWLQWREDMPLHLAITATYRERRTLIHALRKDGVVEHGFVGVWRGRVHSYWRLPGVSY